ncbi:MAG: HEAT repeat domain-containing protein [Bacteroidales bacterium]|nr:MAG: HEAT repeat domain-containing protein [Bacteroidales bacterium]
MKGNTNCEQISIWLVDFADGTLDKETYRNVYEHLESCKACSQNLQEIKALLEELGTVENEVPPGSLKEGFHKMLNSEISKSGIRFEGSDKEKSGLIRILPKRNRSFWFQIAAAVALLVAGALIDNLLLSGSRQKNISADTYPGLENQKTAGTSLLAFNLLNEESPSVRIRAIDSLRSIPEPDSDVIDVLFSVLNMDDNVNVRFSAAQTLAQNIQHEYVRAGLIESLTIQNEPLIQIALIHVLVQSGEIRAGDVMKQLVYNPGTQEIVRTEARKGLDILRL